MTARMDNRELPDYENDAALLAGAILALDLLRDPACPRARCATESVLQLSAERAAKVLGIED